jgi:hypothetical protein
MLGVLLIMVSTLHPLLIFCCMHIVMSIGLGAQMIGGLPQILPFIWVRISYLGLLRNNSQCLTPRLKLNIVAWRSLPLKSAG